MTERDYAIILTPTRTRAATRDRAGADRVRSRATRAETREDAIAMAPDAIHGYIGAFGQG
jgi:hypothetical protein